MSFNEWTEVLLEELPISIVDGDRGKNYPRGNDFSDNGYCLFINAKNVTLNGFLFDEKMFITEEKDKQLRKGKLIRNDVILTTRGTVGNVAYYSKDIAYNNIRINSGMVILRSDEKMINPKFVYYVFRTPYVIRQISAIKTGSAQPQLPISVLKKLIIKLTNLAEQKGIVRVLSILDEKIEVNSRINKILENMGQEIFKRWFIDYDFPNEDGEPYKSSDGEMVESELGLIPRGWSVGTLSELVDSTLGGDWGKEIAQENYDRAVYCIRGADIEPIKQGEQGKAPKRYILEKNLVKKRLEPGNLIIEISGGSPTQSTGRVLYVSEQVISRFEEPIICTNFCRAIKLKKREYMEFVYYYWDLLYRENVFFNYENGTTGIKNLDINSFLNRHQIIIPSENTIFEFTKIMQLLQKNIQSNGTQNRRIGDIRDLLLPKLMSGEIRVPLEEAKY